MRSYDALSEVYALFADDFDYPKWAQYYRALLRRAGVEAQSVVDAGCGAGLMSAELAREGARVVGIEVLKSIFRNYLAARYNEKYNARLAMIAEIEREGK